MKIEKGKTSNGYAKKDIFLKITHSLAVGRYFFMEITKSKRIIIK
jgi:hypothetical protein